MNPFTDMPKVTDIGDGRKLVETHDRGHCIRMIEPSTPPKPPAPASDEPFFVRHTSNGQEIVSAEGEVIASTKKEANAKHLCTLLIVWENLKKKQAGA